MKGFNVLKGGSCRTERYRAYVYCRIYRQVVNEASRQGFRVCLKLKNDND